MDWRLPIVILFVLFNWCYSRPKKAKPVQTLQEMVQETCLHLTGYRLVDDNNTFHRMIEALSYSTVRLACSFCGEINLGVPRLWLWKPRKANALVQELQMGLGPTLEDNRVFAYPNHTLIIHNVTVEDAGVYYCKGLLEDDLVEFQFGLDIVTADVTVVEKKDTSWEDYNNGVIAGVNERIYTSNNQDIRALLEKLKVKVVSEWNPWLPCDGCAGLRRRYAMCRMHVKLNHLLYPDIADANLNDRQSVLYHSAIFSCHSLDLARWYPTLFSLTNLVPNYLEVQPCVDSCSAKQRSDQEPRYHLNYKMNFGASMSFVCPESDLRSKVVWRKNGIKMKPMRAKISKKKEKVWYPNPMEKKEAEFSLARAFVDRMHILQLCLVNDQQTGVYICYVGGVAMKTFNITVVTSEETIRERESNFWLLTFYTACISGVMVLIGLCRSFLNRDKFEEISTPPPASYTNLKDLRYDKDDPDSPNKKDAVGLLDHDRLKERPKRDGL